MRSVAWLVAFGWAALGIGLAAVGCGGQDSDATLLPPPSSSGQAGSTSSNPPEDAAGAPAAPGTNDCPAYTPDACPAAGAASATGAAAKPVCVSLQDDSLHCGACGNACEPQAVCIAGKCSEPPVEVATSAGCGEARLSVHGDRLFWNEPQSGRVRSVSISGGAVTDLATNQAGPGQVAVDDSYVYWPNAGDGTSGSSNIRKVALSGAEMPVLVKAAPATDPITGIAVAAGKLFYGLGHDVHAIATDAPDAADDIVAVAVARNDTMMPDGIPAALSVHGDRVYWIVTDVGSVESDDLLPGAAGYTRIGHSGQMWPNDLGFAGQFAYYAAFGSVYLAQADLPAIAIASINDGTVGAFALSETSVYFSDDSGRLFKHGLEQPEGAAEPAPPTRVAQDQHKVTSVVLDATDVYWAVVDAAQSCTIRKAPL